MQTLRVKLNIPDEEAYQAAKNAFDEISEIHEDQAIFQVNQTQYVSEATWGFKITYRGQSQFVQTTSLREIERAMSQVAPNTFDERLRETGGRDV